MIDHAEEFKKLLSTLKSEGGILATIEKDGEVKVSIHKLSNGHLLSLGARFIYLAMKADEESQNNKD